jgi:hypothetical protein
MSTTRLGFCVLHLPSLKRLAGVCVLVIGMVEGTADASTLKVFLNYAFDVSDGSHENTFQVLPNGFVADVNAVDFGNSTQYVMGNFAVFDVVTGPITISATVTHSTNMENGDGDGCSLITTWPYSYPAIFEDCITNGTNQHLLNLSTNTFYYIETNAQAYSRAGEFVSFHSVISLAEVPEPNPHLLIALGLALVTLLNLAHPVPKFRLKTGTSWCGRLGGLELWALAIFGPPDQNVSVHQKVHSSMPNDLRISGGRGASKSSLIQT